MTQPVTVLVLVTFCAMSCRSERTVEGSVSDPRDIQRDASPPPEVKRVRVVRRSVASMGTLFDLSLAVNEENEAVDEAVEKAFDEIRRVDSLMTTWRPDSYLSQVNAHAGGKAVRVPAELLDLIETAIEISRSTKGKFDISFAAMGGLWDFKLDRPKLPSRTEIRRRLPLINYRLIKINRKLKTLRLAKAGMRIGLGAIAKGYAVDRTGAILKEQGYNDFIVYGGGDLLVSGTKGDRPWKVGIQDPREPSRYFASMELPDGGAVVTSGDYEKFFFLKGKRYHHIISPDTGFPARGTVSVTVLARTATLADALATGAFVLGPEEGMKMIEDDPDLEGIVVNENLKATVSSGLKSRVSLRPIVSSGEGTK
ncbi:MAG: FAD:protein FMN transferase [Deltaproteobacteria bacterium]|nr:FAD:protein FMN transferase [Deltaproteobacteria bacterium]